MEARTTGKLIIANSSWSAGAAIAYTVLAILSAPLYLHHLGINQYGIFVLLNSTIAPLGLLNMGMGQAAIKFMAAALARRDDREANAFLQATVITTGGLGAIGVLAVVMAAHLITSRVFHFNAADQRIAYLSIPWVALTWLLSQLGAQFSAVPSAMQRYNITSTGTTFFRAITLGAGLTPLWMGGGLLAVLQVRCVSVFFIMIAWMIIAKKLLPSIGARPCVTRAIFSKCMNFGAWQLVASAGGVVTNNADKALLGMYASDVAVGLFAVPQYVVDTAYSLVSRAGEVLLPAVSEIDYRAGRGRSFLVALRAGWILSMITTAMMGCLAILCHDTLRLYVGQRIADASAFLLILIALTRIVASGSTAIQQYLYGIADTKRTAVLAVASGIVNTAGCALLIPRFGLKGAAWADVAAIVLVRPWIQHIVWRESGGSVSWKVCVSYLYGPAIFGVPLSIALYLIRRAIPWQCGWFGLAGLSLLFGSILVAGVVLLDRMLPDSEQRRTDLVRVVRHVLKIPSRALDALAFASGR